ncbi:MAG: cyclic peptide export ABC transporter [Planctomycetaceae bacterium]|nr:cyclic peptide export ABC transporter [Planctomycetaceae bacterium]
MRLILFLLRASWPIVLLAGAVGALSGIASMGLVVMILRTLRDTGQSLWPLALFAALCLVVLSTQVVSHMLLSKLTLGTIARLRVGLCRRILESPLKHLEEIGSQKLLNVLTGDVNVVSQAMNGVPMLAVNFVILLCGASYLGWLSPSLLLGAVLFGALGMGSYWYSSRGAQKYVRRSRDAQDVLFGFVRGLIEGVKEMKMHHARRRVFVEKIVESEAAVRDSKFVGDCLHDAAISWGRLTFFLAIGLLLFLWPKLTRVDSETMTGYAFTIFYLMSPLEQIIGWLPFVAWASGSVGQIERLGLMLNEEELGTEQWTPVQDWRQIDFRGVTHTYHREGHPDGFELGPIDLSVRRGEMIFIIGGNGSGKTTLGKLIAGLYLPESGGVALDGQPVTNETREGYRQLFSVVFDDAMVFDNLWGLDADPKSLDQRAGDYLRQLQLDHVVTVCDGAFSTVKLSRGQRKRLALVTAYLEDRSIYLFDEWAADQDPAFRKIFYLQLLPELKQRGKTVIAITHDDRYFGAADRIVKLEEGKVVDMFRHEVPQNPEQKSS